MAGQGITALQLWLFLNGQQRHANMKIPVTMPQLWFFLHSQNRHGSRRLPVTAPQLWFFLRSHSQVENRIMKCPRCDGSGSLFPGIPPGNQWYSKYLCIRCHGSGEVPTEMLEWMIQGNTLKERVAELKMYDKEAENATGLDSTVIYKIKDGLIPYPTKPNPLHRLNRWIREQESLGLWPPKDWEKRT